MNLDQKYELIHAHEKAFCYRLAQEVVRKPEASVWMILIPVLFVHHFYKIKEYKEGVRSFAEHLLSTKNKALDKAYDQALAGTCMNYGMDAFFPVDALSEQEQELAQIQLKVIKVMEEHYLHLLQVSGHSLAELVQNAYQSPERYRGFMNRLVGTEQELNTYLLRKVHTSEESRLVLRQVEQKCARLREEEFSLLFS